MIDVTCDRCERTIQFGEDQGGQKLPCPHCGDINRVPGSPAPAPGANESDSAPAKPRDRAAAAGYPPDAGPEQTVTKIRPAMLRAKPFSFLGLMLLTLSGIGTAIASLFTGPGVVLGWLGGVVAVIGLIALGVWKIMTFAASLEITNKRTIMREGLFRRATSEVLHDSIRNIQIDQTFWNRVWRVGAIGISSSGQDGIEIQLANLPRPDEIRRIIDLYRPL
ncbi:MAG: PH domain-containing protein [Planctomycetota bacterium]